MAEEREVLPEDVYFLEHVGLTRDQLQEPRFKRCKICRKKSQYGENTLCMLCPYPTFFCWEHEVDVCEIIGEDSTFFGLCGQHRDDFRALTKHVCAKHGQFPARDEDHPTDWKRKRADLDWQEELRREILRFRIKAYGRPAPKKTKADESQAKAKTKRATPAQ